MRRLARRLVRLAVAWLYAEDCRAYYRPAGTDDGFTCTRTRHHFGRHRP